MRREAAATIRMTRSDASSRDQLVSPVSPLFALTLPHLLGMQLGRPYVDGVPYVPPC